MFSHQLYSATYFWHFQNAENKDNWTVLRLSDPKGSDDMYKARDYRVLYFVYRQTI
jgi:hypothetical protein